MEIPALYPVIPTQFPLYQHPYLVPQKRFFINGNSCPTQFLFISIHLKFLKRGSWWKIPALYPSLPTKFQASITLSIHQNHPSLSSLKRFFINGKILPSISTKFTPSQPYPLTMQPKHPSFRSLIRLFINGQLHFTFHPSLARPGQLFFLLR